MGGSSFKKNKEIWVFILDAEGRRSTREPGARGGHSEPFVRLLTALHSAGGE